MILYNGTVVEIGTFEMLGRLCCPQTSLKPIKAKQVEPTLQMYLRSAHFLY